MLLKVVSRYFSADVCYGVFEVLPQSASTGVESDAS